MDAMKHYQKILESLSREELEDEMKEILNLLFHRLSVNDPYSDGWDASRESIIKLCKLEKYRYHDTK